MVIKNVEIPEAKIRQALWMIKSKKTKKAICEHLGIAYNTKRVDNIINDFLEKEERTLRLKKAAKTKEFTNAEKTAMAKDYQDGDSVSGIAKRNYISSQKVKSFLLELGVPIRSRKKSAPAQTDHVVQDLDIRFSKGDKVFHGPTNCFAVIEKTMDEDYIEYLQQGIQKYVELTPFDYKKHKEPIEDVHFNIYWILEDGVTWKLPSLKNHIKAVLKHIEDYGRESYLLWIEGDYSHQRMFVPRHELFPVIKK